MWIRRELKERGKTAMHRNYWITVAATLIVGLLTGDFVNSSGNSARAGSENINSIRSIFHVVPIMWIVGIILGVITATTIYSVFVSNVFEVGSCRFFEVNSKRKADLGLLLDGFRNGSYLKNVSTLFFRDLYLFLWSLCLIIPGIVKSYEYKMIPYILAENPNISRKRAFEISKQMMDGQKLDAFILDWSFIGWEFLSFITLGIVGIFYVNPYETATWAELYMANREMAIESGIAAREELSGFYI